MEGKCKDSFEKWYNEQPYSLGAGKLMRLENNLQWGVIVDFFDSVELFIKSDQCWLHDVPQFIYEIQYESEHEGGYTCWVGDWSPSRAEARTEAIKKAASLYNER